ncbi:MAG: sensor histidine kinase, partial [Bacteroidota bacterium]
AAEQERKTAELDAELSQKKLTLEQNRRDILEKNSQIYFLITITVFLILGYILLRNTNKKRRELLQAQLETSEKAREADTLRAIIYGEEQERKRLARELHDGLGSQLATVKMLVGAIQNDLPEVKDSELHQKAETMLDDACKEIREISHNLMPGTISRYGLEQAVSDMCINLEQSQQLQVSCMLHIDKEIDENMQVAVYRIIQELLRNVVKHAEAQEVIVQLQTEDNQIELTLEDDGKGFEPSLQAGDGIGLKNIRSRVEVLKGNIDIDSKSGSGTSVYINIPLV